MNKAQAWTKIDVNRKVGDIEKLRVLPSTHIGNKRYMR